jgi:ribose 5-phosphate isomerase A
MVVGLGTGSTVKFAIEELGKKITAGELSQVKGIPSSKRTAEEARQSGIPLTSLDEYPVIDLTIDGADEVDPELNLIKGGGGALFQEKILAECSKQMIVIVDQSKLSGQLGSLFPVPVEILPLACGPLKAYSESLGAQVNLRQQTDRKVYLTDQGNYILDCQFGPIASPGNLAEKLKARAGIIEHGLFLGLASEIIVAGDAGIRILRRQ